ncbi:MBL fold metallo-hydrolase [Elongatibacter sediminis]|uniref:MBL fold metallo-hydrolase n=1 Tax=Elongatibacter sediminis TaxID=3119006 RepID=A0AAW9R9C9_9GAMM
MEIEFYGAAGEVTGSCHVLRTGSHTVLLDCGLIQGSRRDEARNADPFPFDAADIDAVVLSHAHLDHSGRLPLLVKRGFRGPVFAQNATGELVAILLADAAHLAERDAEYHSRKTGKQVKPLFTVAEGAEVMRQMRGVKYHEIFDVVPGVRARFRDAGHILGSCAAELFIETEAGSRTVVFSGDLGQYDTPILRDPDPIDEADVVLMESTYGNRRHRDREATVREIGEIIRAARASQGNILIPAFAIGRSQEVLYQLGKHYEEWGLDRFQIFLDSPMAVEASRVYWENSHLYDEEASRLRSGNGGMPLLPNLRLTRDTEDSIAINRLRAGAIIIAGSGMCNGGRIIHHLKHNLPSEKNHVIIVGYQAYGSLGRRLVDGAERVRIHRTDVAVKATIHTVGGLSAHGDLEDMSRWYGHMKGHPPVYLVHGERDSQAAFKTHLQERFGCRVALPEPGETLDLSRLPG